MWIVRLSATTAPCGNVPAAEGTSQTWEARTVKNVGRSDETADSFDRNLCFTPWRGGVDSGEENLMLEGSCDCGAVRYSVDGTLDEVTECNCGICRRSGGLWAYYSPKKVTMTGPTDIYMRGDRMLEMHHCKTCRCLMWWVPVDKSHDRMGVNARMLPLGAWDETPIKKCDGASW